MTEPDEEIGATRLTLVDLPFLGAGPRDTLALWVAASSAGAFRPVPVQASVNGQPLAGVTISRRAVLGVAQTALAGAPATLIDTGNAIEVVLANPAQLLFNADDDALAMGANLALIGAELIQFGRAELVVGGRYRLSRLLRGRRGTEAAIVGHQAADVFLLIESAALAMIEIDGAMRGASVTATAFGVADDPLAPPSSTRIAAGENLRPLAPVGIMARAAASGGIDLTWIERSRDAYAWTDGVGGTSEGGTRFEIVVTGTGGEWRGDSAEAGLHLDSVMLATIGAGAALVRISALNSLARSRPAELTIQI